jgi:hypothetical protein
VTRRVVLFLVGGVARRAVVPHPNNFSRGGKPAQGDGASDGALQVLPYEQRTAARVDQTPVPVRCLPHSSPAVLVVSNLSGAAAGQDPSFVRPVRGHSARPTTVTVGGGGSWHTDIEYEPLPMYVSMFLVHHAPSRRDAPGGTWVPPNHPRGSYFGPDEPEGAPASAWAGGYEQLSRHREALPLNGETAFADTAAAFAALPAAQRAQLSALRLRRRLNAVRPHAVASTPCSPPRPVLNAPPPSTPRPVLNAPPCPQRPALSSTLCPVLNACAVASTPRASPRPRPSRCSDRLRTPLGSAAAAAP